MTASGIKLSRSYMISTARDIYNIMDTKYINCPFPIVDGQVICFRFRFRFIVEKGTCIIIIIIILLFMDRMWYCSLGPLEHEKIEASRIIIGITIGLRALVLEEHRVVRGWACKYRGFNATITDSRRTMRKIGRVRRKFHQDWPTKCGKMQKIDRLNVIDLIVNFFFFFYMFIQVNGRENMNYWFSLYET